MKTILKFFVAITAVIAMSATVANAQIDYENDPKYKHLGADAATREEVLKKFSFLRDAWKMKSYDDYMTRYKEMIELCPNCYPNLYLFGIQLNRAKLNQTTDPAEREKYTKIMAEMYDGQIKYFGTKNGVDVSAPIYRQKMQLLMAVDFNKYLEDIKKIMRTVADKGIKNDNQVRDMIYLYFSTITTGFLSDEISAETVLDEYDYLSDAISKSQFPDKNVIQQPLDNLLLNSGAADCDNLVALFKPKYEKEPNNLELIKKIMRYLNEYNCDGEFKVLVAEKYYKLDPSADAAYSLALSFAASGDTQKSEQYFKEAINRETNRTKKSKYQNRLAVDYLINKQYQSSANLAKGAISSDPRNGQAYFLLAQAYSISLASGVVKCDAFEVKAAFWLVNDLLQKAKSLTPASAPAAKDIIKQIEAAKANIPTSEDLFFKEELKVGGAYNVNCGWVKGATKVQKPTR